MRSRCYNPKNNRFAHYGARGIVVCERWRDNFPSFLADMGERPTPQHSLDRRDGNGNYEPGNCRWATRLEQARNRGNNRIITVNGDRVTISQAAEAAGIKRGTLQRRIAIGRMSGDDAVTRPLRVWPGRAYV